MFTKVVLVSTDVVKSDLLLKADNGNHSGNAIKGVFVADSELILTIQCI